MKKLFPVLCCLFFVACSKYPDGPMINLQSKTKRLCKSWTVRTALKNARYCTAEFKSHYPDYLLLIERNNSYVLTWSKGNYSESGTWSWNADKMFVSFTNAKTNYPLSWNVLRLTEDEWWVKYVDDNGNDCELRLEPAK